MRPMVNLHETLLDSSIWLEDTSTRMVWITMLLMADEGGVVHASVRGLAHRARVEADSVRAAVVRFLTPDPDSMDGTTGERIEVVTGGWRLLNHGRYRDSTSRSQRLKTERQRRWRKKKEEREAESLVDGV